MLCLSVQQPWAWAIAAGIKRIENRSWETRYRGPLAIHAGKSLGRLAGTDPVAWHSIIPGLPDFDQLPFGALVAVCTLTNVVPVESVQGKPFAEGPFCWLLDDVFALEKPIPLTGRQGLFEVADNLIPPREPGELG